MDVFRRQCSRSHSMNTYSTSEEFRTRWKVSANIATSRFTITMHEMNKSDDHEASCAAALKIGAGFRGFKWRSLTHVCNWRTHRTV